MASRELEKKLEDLQVKFKRKRRLVIERYAHEEGKTLKQFIEEFFTTLNGKNTIYPVSKKVQCTPWRNRSMGDMYMIIKSYYPDVTVKEVAKALAELTNDNILSVSFCSTIKKRVFERHSHGNWWNDGNLNGDENQLKGTEYKSLIN